MAFGEIAVDLLFEAYVRQYDRKDLPPRPDANGVRALNVAGGFGRPPSLLILDPDIETIDQSRRITQSVNFDLQVSSQILAELRKESAQPEDHQDANLRTQLVAQLLRGEPQDLLDFVGLMRPEVIVSRLPRMERLCAPASSVRVHAKQVSSLGIFCHDSEGVFGATACYHGTGPVGTAVTVDGVKTQVSRADVVQDIVFIPLPRDLANRHLAGRAGVRQLRQPAQSDPAHFDGATSGPTETIIDSNNPGLLRPRPSVQLRIQTRADTNRGDSGCALIDEHDQVLGFAFERSAIGDFPEFSEWIWADNALRALQLTPV